MDIKDSYLHGTVGVVKSISVSADKLKYTLADIAGTVREVTLPVATTSANGLMSSGDKTKLDNLSTTLGNYVTLNTDQDITGIKTFTKQQKFIVAQGTAPFAVTSTTKVANLNSDYLDGFSSDSFARVSYNESLDANDILEGIIGGKLYGASNFPYAYYSFLSVGQTKYKMQFNGYANELKYRAGDENGLDTKVWRTVAFTDSDITGSAAHASTADKLKTKRKLWGQNFDGSADVSGNMTGVGSITASGTIQTPTLYGQGTNGGAKLYFGIREGLALGIEPYDTDGTWLNNGIQLFLDGSVSIGTSAKSEKLYVNGNVKATSFIGNLDGTYVNKLTNYNKATAVSAIAATDSLNTALGKLEFKTDFIYEDLFGTDNDTVINKWHEIVDFIDSVKEGTDITDEFVTRKTTQVITGQKNFNTATNSKPLKISRLGNDVECLNIGVSDNTALFDLLQDEKAAHYKFTGTWSNLSDGGDGTLAGTAYVEFVLNSSDKGIYLNDGTSTKTVLHSGNTYINSGTITINGSSITPITSHQSLANYVTLNTGQIITGFKTFKRDGNIITSIESNNSVESSIRYINKDSQTWIAGVGTASIADSFGIWSNTLQNNVITCLANGNVGIGIRTASEKLHVSGNILATKFITSGGTSSQFVKGDGSLDSTSYATATSLGNYLPLTGGTMTGKIDFANTTANNLTNHYISAGGGYGTGSGRLGLKLVTLDQTNAQMGFGVDLTGLTYEHTIVTSRNSDTSTSYITFATHTAGTVSYKQLGYFKASDYTNPVVTFKVNGAINADSGVINGHFKVANTEGALGTLLLSTGTATNKPRIRFEGDGSWGYLGFSGANKPCYYNNSLVEYTLWHSGNDGDSSGLDADLLDGKHASEFAPTSHGVHWIGFTRRTSSYTWGTLTSANGYSPLFWLDSTSGGGVAFSDKNEQTSMQIDGYFYQKEGARRVTDVTETVTALGTNGNYLTWSKNGSVNNITVPYATNSNYLYADSSTTPTVWAMPEYLFTGHSGIEDYLKKYINKLIQSHSGHSGMVGIGTTHPNSQRLTLFRAYSLNDYNNTGLPQHCSGFSVDYDGYTTVWGTAYGSWYYKTLLDSSNYTTYTVKKDGTGATGTWGINISGNAATANLLNTIVITEANFNKAPRSGFYNITKASTTTLPGTVTSGNVAIRACWDNGTNYAGLDLLINDSTTSNLYFRASVGGQKGSWRQLATISDIPTVTNYYWANIPVSSTSSTTTKPTFANVKTGGVENTGEYLWKGSSNFKCVPSSNNQEWSFDLGNVSYTDATDSGYTGTYLQVWSAKHSASIASFHNDSRYVGINVTSPEKTLDVNGIQQIYQRGLDNTLFKDLLLLKQQNSSEGTGQSWDESYPSFGIGFRRYWTSGTSPYGETTCAGIYTTVSSSWRGGLVFRTKNNTTNGGTHDVTALKLRPDGVAVFANYVYTPSGFVHSGYNSSAYALTSNGGVAKIADMSVNYAASAGSVAWGNITGKPGSFTPASHTHTYIESKANYTFTSSTLPNSFDWGVSAGFVNSDSGFGSFGSVLTVRTYSGGGGTLQLYAPYSKTYGGERLKARFGNYDSSTGNSWTTLKEIAWVGDIPTKVSQLTNDSGYITSYKNTWYGDGLWTPSTNITLNATANSQEWSFDIYRNGNTGCYWHVWDNALSTLLKVNADDGKVSAPYGFVGNLTGSASEAKVLCADGTMKLYANHSNEVNFGGSNTSGTIYFGYRATDSKPVPTSFVFGDSTGSATLTSSGFKKKSSSDSYVLLGGGGHKALSDFSMAHSHSYHPLGGSWKPSSLSSYTRHWGWAYSSAEAGLASDGSAMQIYTDGKFWQREGAYYCLDNGNTYVSSGTGVINGSTITYVSTAGTANASYYVYDYNATTTPIYIGYAGAALSTATHFAAYGTTSSGARCIKDIPVATVKSVLEIPSFAAKGSSTKGVYLSAANTFSEMTYSLSATVNSGTSSKLAYYSGTNAISAYTSNCGDSYKPIYLSGGVPIECYSKYWGAVSWGTNCSGTIYVYQFGPIVILQGYVYKLQLSNTSSTSYVFKLPSGVKSPTDKCGFCLVQKDGYENDRNTVILLSGQYGYCDANYNDFNPGNTSYYFTACYV